MKSNSLNLRKILLATVTISTALFFTSHADAQDKPKGKPWPAPAAAIAKKNPVSGAEAMKEGKSLYMQHCKSCHGSKGQGDAPKAAKLDISSGDFTTAEFAKISEGELYWKTTEGRKPMPAFKGKLSDNERWSIISFIKTMSK